MPEVETVRRELEPWLSGRRVVSAERLAPAGPKYADLERASGQTIQAVTRRGKFMLLPLSGGDELIIHLGMTGVVSPGHRQGGGPHLRVRLRLDGGEPDTLEFHDPRRFGRFLVVRSQEYQTLPTLAALGPEPLGDDFTDAGFAAALARSRAPIKTYLLSQRPVAGVGNIYADEALWRARVHPLASANSLSRVQTAVLRVAIRDVLAASIAANGTTLRDYRTPAGASGEFEGYLDVYGRGGSECRSCGAVLVKSVVGQRGTVHCPVCQPLQPQDPGAR